MQRVLEVSERRACRVLDQPRSSQRYQAQEGEEQRRLVGRMRALSEEHPRYGYRRITALLRREGWQVNRKRVQRWRGQEGLKVPRKQHKKRRRGTSEGESRHRAERKNQVWSYDFLEDRTEDGRKLRLLVVVDEFTRECLGIEVERSMTAAAVVETLRYLFELRGVPEFIRSDNGPEFIAWAVKGWLGGARVKTLYIDPGSPWENPYSESFNSRFRDELLDREMFTSLAEAKVLVEDYRLDYNHRRPHSALGYQTPAEFAATWGKACSATLRSPSPKAKVDSLLSVLS